MDPLYSLVKTNDGRIRSHEDVEIIDQYDLDNIAKRRVLEQDNIDADGGVGNLDNRRNEVSDNNRDNYGLGSYPNKR